MCGRSHSTARVVSSHGRGVSMRHGDAKVAFVSDNPGTSYGEVNAVVFVVIVAAWASLTVRERCEAQAWTSAKTTMTTLLVGTETAMLALATLASMFAVTKALAVACAVAGGCFLYWARNARPRWVSRDSAAFTCEDGLTLYRFTLAMMTVVAILAVDFTPFPRRLGKTETYGVSLMDVGAGSFVFSSSVVSRFARGKEKRNLHASLRKAMQVMFLGLARLAITTTTGYHSVESEYGRHWNFFFTLALIQVCADTLPIASHRALPCGLLISIAYQYVLCCHGLSAWILQTPDARSHESATNVLTRFVSMNREGVSSACGGYFAIHLIAAHLGNALAKPVLNFSTWLQTMARVTCAFWFAAIAFHAYVEPTSRRAGNAAYVLWIVAFNLQVIIVYVCMTWFARSANGRGKCGIPVLARAINRRQLFVFVVGNALTGLTNLAVDTINADINTAWGVMTLYVSAISIVALSRNAVAELRSDS